MFWTKVIAALFFVNMTLPLMAVFVPQKSPRNTTYTNRFIDQYYIHNRFYYSQYPYEFDVRRNKPYFIYYTDPRAFYEDNGGIYYRR